MAFAAKKNVPIIPVQLGKMPDKPIPDWFTLDYDELHRHIIEVKRYNKGVKKVASAICRLRRPQPQEDALGKPQSPQGNPAG
jgi:hypothetical protein